MRGDMMGNEVTGVKTVIFEEGEFRQMQVDLKHGAFLLESVGHLQGREKDFLPPANALRMWAEKLAHYAKLFETRA
jgi:hypothetical protein